MESFLESSWIAFRRAHGELFGELMESFLESLSIFKVCQKEFEVSQRHGGASKTQR